MRFAASCATAYQAARPRTGKPYNRAGFDRLLVRDCAIAEVEYHEPFELTLNLNTSLPEMGLWVELRGDFPADHSGVPKDRSKIPWDPGGSLLSDLASCLRIGAVSAHVAHDCDRKA